MRITRICPFISHLELQLEKKGKGVQDWTLTSIFPTLNMIWQPQLVVYQVGEGREP